MSGERLLAGQAAPTLMKPFNQEQLREAIRRVLAVEGKHFLSEEKKQKTSILRPWPG
jgi:hypothetical protein